MAGPHSDLVRAGVRAVLLAVVVGNAIGARATNVEDTMPARVDGKVGEPGRGRTLMIERDASNCVLCHAVPDPAFPVAGNVGPSLAGIGSRLTEAQIRLRIVDITRLAPDAVMPSYFRSDGLADVAQKYRGKTLLSAQDVEDLVAYLGTLK